MGMAVCVEMAVAMAGIESATAALAGRARYLSCHPRRQVSAHLPRPAVFMVLTLWTCQLSSLYERLSGRELSGTVNSAELNENRPGGAFPGAAAGKCLLALTRQPLRRRGQPKAATPDSCIRAASAPGERSCIDGKPMTETGQSYFPGHSAMRARLPATVVGYRWVDAGFRCDADTAVRCRTS